MTTGKIKSVCPYCGVGCGIVLEVSDNRVVKITGDKEHPANFGRLCTKGSTAAAAITESGRMEYAYSRPSRGIEPVQMEINAAIRDTAQRLRSILEEHGPEALSIYVSGQMSLEAQYLINKLAKGFIRTPNMESNSRLCMAGVEAMATSSLWEQMALRVLIRIWIKRIYSSLLAPIWPTVIRFCSSG